MWRNIGLVAVGILVGIVGLIALVLMSDPPPPETAYRQTGAPQAVSRNVNERELVMADGPLFACRSPAFFTLFAELFTNSILADEEKVMRAEGAMQGLLSGNYCVYLRAPIMLTRMEKVGGIKRATGGVVTSYTVFVHAPGSDQHYFSTIVLIDGKKYDHLSLTLFVLKQSVGQDNNPKKRL